MLYRLAQEIGCLPPRSFIAQWEALWRIYTGSGFLGAFIASFLAGYITLLIINYIHLPKTVAGLKSILIVPLLSYTDDRRPHGAGHRLAN
nr:hypothetical protein [Sodalis-like endosymbiont of Proechinophthirus fluctus]